MNNCILMADIIQEPQLRYTSDSQIPVAEMVVQFEGLRDDDPTQTLKVVGWGNLAQEIQERYHQGDRVIIEGRLHMNTIDRPEGFKEKRAELTAQRIHRLGAGATIETSAGLSGGVTQEAANPTEVASPSVPATPRAAKLATPAKTPAYAAPAPAETVDYDDIPF